jgi:hypothetical protein
MFSASIDLAEASSIPQAMEFPPAREFLVSAGFGGALALLAVLLLALLVLVSGWRATKRHREELEQRERHYDETRAEKERAADLAVCEQRFRWVVETAGIEPAAGESATLGLGPELALELLSGLHRDAKRLDDDTLAKAIGVYLSQFALVLAQQGGPLSQLRANRGGASIAKQRSATTRGEAGAPASDNPAATASPPDSDDDSPAEAVSGSAPGRRRRR